MDWIRSATGEEDSPERVPVIHRYESPKGPERLLNIFQSRALLVVRLATKRRKSKKPRKKVTCRSWLPEVEDQRQSERLAPREES